MFIVPANALRARGKQGQQADTGYLRVEIPCAGGWRDSIARPKCPACGMLHFSDLYRKISFGCPCPAARWLRISCLRPAFCVADRTRPAPHNTTGVARMICPRSTEIRYLVHTLRTRFGGGQASDRAVLNIKSERRFSFRRYKFRH